MQYLFILCYGRTGSTVVQGLLNRLDGYCIRGERKGVLTGLAKAAGSARRGKSDFAASDEELGVKSPHFGVSEIDPDQFAQSLAKLFTDEMLTPPPGTRVCGLKDITMSTKAVSDGDFDDVIAFVLERFASSRIIFLTRAAQEVSQSGWWAKEDPQEVRQLIEASDARFAKACKAHPDRTFHLDYSEFRDSVQGFRRLLEWLGEPVDEQMLADISSTKLMHMKPKSSAEPQAAPGLMQKAKNLVKRIIRR